MSRFFVRGDHCVVGQWDENEDALETSIAKWRFIVSWLTDHPNERAPRDGGGFTCALCSKFHRKGNFCQGCPIKLHTGNYYCWGTPYRSYASASNRHAALEAAQKELGFLESLRAQTID